MKIKSIIAALILAASSAFAQVPVSVSQSNLIVYYSFQNTANDYLNNCNGLVNGASITSDAQGNINSAYSFNGTNSFIDIPNEFANGQTLNSQTFRIKFKINQSGSYTLWNKDGSWQEAAIYVESDNSVGLFWAFPNYYSGIRSNSNTIQTGIWNDVIIIVSNNTGFIYINGALQTSYQFNTITSSNIGYSHSGSCGTQLGFNRFGFSKTSCSAVNYLNGVLDEFGIWNRALTQQEITALYNSQTCNSSSNTITADGPTTYCAGNYVNLTSDVVGGSYQWKKNGVNVTSNGTSRTYKATASGSYTCIATCNGTALTSNAIVVASKTNVFASVTASGATSFCAGDSVTLNCTNLGSNYSVQWYRTNVSMENATNYSQVVKQPGTYKVVTRNLTTGCSRISGSSVVVAVNCRLANPDVIAADITESDFDAVTREAEPKGKIYIYPNPTSDNKFTVELMGLELNGDATLEVYNAMGQILSSEKVNITNGTLNRTIQIDEQSKGQLCLVRLIAGSEVYDSKVILK